MDSVNRGHSHPQKRRQFLIDRQNVSDLALSGKRPLEIAEELGISRTTVWRHLQALDTEWKEERLLETGHRKAKQLAGYEEAAELCLEKLAETGDPKWMQAYLKAMAQIDGIEGLKRETLEVEHTGDAQSVTVVFSGVSTAPTLASPVMLPQGPPAALGEPQDALPAIDLTELELEPEEVE